MNGSDWQIEEDCPQCGAPVLLAETDRILQCPFCRTRLYLVPDGPCRYCLSAAPEAAAKEIFYIPYWRFRGLSYALEGLTLTDRFIDHSTVALAVGGLPRTLGVRPQAMRLRFVSTEAPGAFLAPMARRIDPAPPGGAAFFVGEVISLIYTPAYLQDGVLFDAVLRRPLPEWRNEETEAFLALPRDRGWRIRFVSTLCPNCAWDMEGGTDSLVLHCRNCDSAWICPRINFERVDWAAMSPAQADAAYLPFWKLEVSFDGIALRSYGDLIRLANLPKAVTPALEERPVHFWVPAFKVNPALFLRWVRQMTLYQPEGETADNLPSGPMHPVTIPPGEALEGVMAALAQMVTDKRRFLEIFPQLRVRPERTALVYHPFRVGQRELIHQEMGLTIDRKALGFGSFL